MEKYKNLVHELINRRITISVAESCTGGLICKLITDISGSSRIFIGGSIAYSYEMKTHWLGVRQETLNKFGAVSAETVREMVNGIISSTKSDIGVAVTGIAGPTGGTPEKPVGTVYIAVKFREKENIDRYFFKGSRDDIRTQAAALIPDLIFSLISDAQ
ncbi:MAG: CinA family protein [Calditrichaeota bacterium]|nr:CinA family protein [Calditrichota bacterium]